MIPSMTSPTSQAAAGTIRAEAARRQISHRELAEKLGMSKAALSRRMTGVQAWDLEELHAVAGLFGMDVRDLLPAATSSTTP